MIRINLFDWDILDKLQTRLRGKCKRQIVATKNGLRVSRFGKRHKVYDSKIWQNVREIILERDNYICQKCHKPGNQVHHRDRNPRNLASENLITLCCVCHYKEHPNVPKLFGC